MTKKELEKRVAKLERALRWYADPKHWSRDDWGLMAVAAAPEYGNPGEKARKALRYRAGAPREGRTE